MGEFKEGWEGKGIDENGNSKEDSFSDSDCEDGDCF